MTFSIANLIIVWAYEAPCRRRRRAVVVCRRVRAGADARDGARARRALRRGLPEGACRRGVGGTLSPAGDCDLTRRPWHSPVSRAEVRRAAGKAGRRRELAAVPRRLRSR